jgi:hypothetical protein
VGARYNGWNVFTKLKYAGNDDAGATNRSLFLRSAFPAANAKTKRSSS